MSISTQARIDALQTAIDELETLITASEADVDADGEVEAALHVAHRHLSRAQHVLYDLLPRPPRTCDGCGLEGPDVKFVMPDGHTPACDRCSMARSWQYEDAGDDCDL